MTEPSQYFKGRTVQEQMDEVIGYVDVRAEEVAAAKANAVLQPAEQAKTAAQAAAEAAEAAKDATIAALPAIQQDISGLKAEDTALDGRLDTVELKVQTAEGNIVTIQGRITAIENKNTQQDSAIAALQTADGQNVKINNINQYAVGLTGNQNIAGNKTWMNDILIRKTNPGYLTVDDREFSTVTDSQTTGNRVVSILDNGVAKNLMVDQIRVSGFGVVGGVERLMWTYCKINDAWKSVILRVQMNPDTGKAQLRFGNTVIAEVDI